MLLEALHSFRLEYDHHSQYDSRRGRGGDVPPLYETVGRLESHRLFELVRCPVA